MPLRLPSRRVLLVVAAFLMPVYVIAWLAVPPLVQSRAQEFINAKSGHRLTMAKPDFNPLTLSLTLHNLLLAGADEQPLLACRELELNVSTTSLLRAALVFDAIRIDGLNVTLTELPGDRLNWSDLVDSLRSKDDASTPSAPPRVDIDTLIVADSRLDFADRRSARGRAITVAPIAIELNNLSTLPNDQGSYEIRTRTGFAEHIDWRGTISLNPLSVAGQLDVGGISLATLAGLFALPSGMDTPDGTASLTTQLKVSHGDTPTVTLDGLAIKLADLKLHWRDVAELVVQDGEIAMDNVTNDPKSTWRLRAALKSRDGGQLDVDGKIAASKGQAELGLKLVDLSLKPLQAYLGAATTLTLADGLLSGNGRLAVDDKGTRYEGSATLRNLTLDVGEQRTPFLKWKSLATRKLAVSGSRLDMADLALDGLDTRLIINADKSTNLGAIWRSKQGADRRTATADFSESSAQPSDANKAKPYAVAIERLRVTDSQLEFADRSLALPFAAHIHHLRGNLDSLGTRADAPNRVQLDGDLNEYGLAHVSGRINLFSPTAYTDLKVAFSNIEMTSLTPYSATFAGRRIDSGKLSLDLGYKIEQGRLTGDNAVTIETLKLGERVESPQAKDLPLDLAVAILQDANGRIELGVPVTGDLKDPDFSYGQVVWKAFANVIGKVVTSPFRALGKLLGSNEGFDSIVYDAGRADLSAPEREKMGKLAAALTERPGLAIEIAGVYADADRTALQDLQLRRQLANWLDRPAEEGVDPGPMPPDDPKVQAALEGLAAEHLTTAERGAIKDPAALYDKLRSGENVPDERLQALATARAEAAFAALRAGSAPMERVRQHAPEKVDAEDGEVPLKLEVKVAP